MRLAVVRPIVKVVTEGRDRLAFFQHSPAAVAHRVAGVTGFRAACGNGVRKVRPVIGMVRRIFLCLLRLCRNAKCTVVFHAARRFARCDGQHLAAIPDVGGFFFLAAAEACAQVRLAVVRPIVEVVAKGGQDPGLGQRTGRTPKHGRSVGFAGRLGSAHGNADVVELQRQPVSGAVVRFRGGSIGVEDQPLRRVRRLRLRQCQLPEPVEIFKIGDLLPRDGGKAVKQHAVLQQQNVPFFPAANQRIERTQRRRVIALGRHKAQKAGGGARGLHTGAAKLRQRIAARKSRSADLCQGSGQHQLCQGAIVGKRGRVDRCHAVRHRADRCGQCGRIKQQGRFCLVKQHVVLRGKRSVLFADREDGQIGKPWQRRGIDVGNTAAELQRLQGNTVRDRVRTERFHGIRNLQRRQTEAAL